MSRADIEAMIRKLEQRKLSHRAIVYTLGSVRQVLACGISSGLLSVNVAASVEAPRKQHSKAVVDTRPKDECWSQQKLSSSGPWLIRTTTRRTARAHPHTAPR